MLLLAVLDVLLCTSLPSVLQPEALVFHGLLMWYYDVRKKDDESQNVDAICRNPVFDLIGERIHVFGFTGESFEKGWTQPFG